MWSHIVHAMDMCCRCNLPGHLLLQDNSNFLPGSVGEYVSLCKVFSIGVLNGQGWWSNHIVFMVRVLCEQQAACCTWISDAIMWLFRWWQSKCPRHYPTATTTISAYSLNRSDHLFIAPCQSWPMGRPPELATINLLLLHPLLKCKSAHHITIGTGILLMM